MPESSQQIDSRPRLLFVGNFLSGENQVPQLCEELADRFEMEGWSVLRTSSKAGKVARLAEMVVTAFRRRGDFDLVQIDLFSGSAFVWAEIVASALQAIQRPFALTLHGGLLPEFSARYPGRVRRLLRSAAVVTSPSAFLAERMREFRSDIEVLPNPLDLERFEFRPRDAPRPRLVWLRAFHEVYRPWLAVEVLGLLAATYPEARLIMFGPDKTDGSKEKTEAAIRRLGLEKRVSLGGAIPAEEVPSSLQDGDVFLNTSEVDNAPRSVVEAMACGLCVVSTDVGGVPYLLDDGQDGLLVPPDDPEAMANAVVRILSDSKLAESLSRNGRGKAESHDWSIVIPRWERLFQEVAKDD